MNTLQRWRFALKPASWRKLIAPALLGQGIGAFQRRSLDVELAIAGALLTVPLLCAIVLLNDFADQKVDAEKRRRFPSSSKKTIFDDVLPAHQILFAGIAATLLYIGTAYVVAEWSNRPGFFVLSLCAIGLFFAYSLPPIRLNYRGGGEFLEMAGVGIALPGLHAYLQGGLGAELPWLPRAWAILLPWTLLALASAIASGLADERSDRGVKRTFTLALGNSRTRGLVELLVTSAILLTLLVGALSQFPLLIAIPAAALLFVLSRRVVHASDTATTENFSGIRRYKAALHNAMWTYADACAYGLIFGMIFLSL